MNVLLSKKGQNLTEVALLVGIVVLAFIGMEVYFKRGLNAKIKFMADKYISGDEFGGGKLEGTAKQELYEIDTHNYTVQESTTPVQSSSTIVSQVSEGGAVTDNKTDLTTVGPSTSDSAVSF